MALSRNSEVARQNARSVKEQVLEAAAVGAVGAALGAGAGTLVGLTGPAAAVAASNGAISGFRQIYEWTSRKGRVAFVLDSTWGLVTTAASLVPQLVGTLTPGEYDESLSKRSNRHVYSRGFVVRRNFAVTVGNVVSGGRYIRREPPAPSHRPRRCAHLAIADHGADLSHRLPRLDGDHGTCCSSRLASQKNRRRPIIVIVGGS